VPELRRDQRLLVISRPVRRHHPHPALAEDAVDPEPVANDRADP
jgi:hypothetical protein